MPATPTIPNEKPTEATTPGGLILVFQMTLLTPRKDSDYDSLHEYAARRKAR